MKLFTAALCIVLVALSTADDCQVNGKDVWGGDLYNWMSPNFQACKDRCRTDSRCRAVVWFNWGALKGKCHMKNGHHSSIRNPCAWCTSAFKPCIDQEGPCRAGQYKSSRLVCSTCPAGSFSGAGASSCASCAPGTFSAAGASSCTACPAGTYNDVERSGSCKSCPADTYNDEAGAKECKSCGEGYTSSEGSSSADSCVLVDDSHCWVLYDDERLTGMYGDAMLYEQATAACMDDEECTGVTCRIRRGDDDCYLASGEEHEEDRGKWATYLKEC